jgi:hypothetical protein
MATPKLNPAQIQYITGQLAHFIADQRRIFRSIAEPLSEEQRACFAPYFPDNILSNTRFVRVDKIVDPPFYPELVKLGFSNLPQSSAMAAATFVDVVAAQQDFYDALRFHELVHAVQYKRLGVATFAEKYVVGFLHGGGYEHIPLEQNAYELDGRFSADPDQRIDVLAEVNRWINEDRF